MRVLFQKLVSSHVFSFAGFGKLYAQVGLLIFNFHHCSHSSHIKIQVQTFELNFSKVLAETLLTRTYLGVLEKTSPPI